MELNKSDKMITFNEMNKGSIVSGTVKNIKPYGAFIQTDNGIDRIAIYRRHFCSQNKDTCRKIKSGTKDKCSC